ncbi:molecular chaperone HtpG [Zavarzinia compransoris]|uniref:Chaperone protein HtpG n=1 Tax=Zavarzinia compransoris TaxID=1264899 RepID=A0A317E6B3_9PROT|nr:molecular chaperone HtpG [Zavarzinia compransoris]PWR21770.1 molecular chaperone HtpG [Zavarzinia compransoris]TDP45431.1 molecular chaperone HtpG [Zavarzinia compransoris]
MTAESIETRGFEAEVARLLHLMVHSVYSEKEIFLRELISNASDACDKLRYAALTEPALTADDPNFRVEISLAKDARTLTIADNGIGMSKDELIANLGTIARSGTSAFVEQLSGDAASDVSLIGRFGVGFYSVFMVAEAVEVVSRRAGSDEAWSWESDGAGTYRLKPATRAGRGTTVTLRLREGEDEFLDAWRLKRIVKTYSDHIALPVILKAEADEAQTDGEQKEDETLNSASALWTRPKSEITAEQYAEFYRHAGHAADEPWATIHWKAEGTIEYTGLLFIPGTRPFDLFDPKRESRLKLYVRRVFITDSCEALLPGYLRFVKGIVDSADLPLNISREMLQESPLTAKIRSGLVKKILSELEKRAGDDGFKTFWDAFGPVLKEGLYEDFERREQILKLARFKTTKSGDETVTLAEYAARMRPNQTALYFITGDAATVARSPQLEAFKARDIEVLLLSDPIDDFWTGTGLDWEGKPFQSVTRGDIDLSQIPAAEDERKGEDAPEGAIASLIAAAKLALGEAVKDVRVSKRLTDSPVCLVAAAGDMDMHLARLMRAARGRDAAPDEARILEINPRHPLVKALAARAEGDGAVDALDDAAHLLLDQARIVEGEAPSDPAAFARRLSEVMVRAVA